MKIAFIVGMFPSLSETFILNQITGLMELGHDVDIFSVNKSDENKRHDIINKLNLMDKVYFFPEIPKNKLLRIIKGKFLFFLNFYKDPKKLLKSINIFSFRKDVFSLSVLFNVIPFLGKRYDIIHAHFGNNGLIGSNIKYAGVQGKLVTTFYGYDITAFVKNNNKVYKNLALYGDLFLPICKYFEKKLISLKFDQKKIKIHPLGIEMDKFTFRERKINSGETINILTVARLTEKKGYIFSLSAIKKLIDKKKNIHYTIIGDGPLLNDIKKIIKKYEIEDYVDLVGAVEQDDVIKHFEKAHIFLLPSITASNGDQEGTPTVLIEAQAFGLPVISTLHSGIPEIVVSGKTGYLVEERNSEEISDKLIYLCESVEDWPEIGRNGRKFVEENFSIDILCKKLENIYSGLLIM